MRDMLLTGIVIILAGLFGHHARAAAMKPTDPQKSSSVVIPEEVNLRVSP